MTKDEALARLRAAAGTDRRAVSLAIVAALEHGASLAEAASALNCRPEDLVRDYADEIAEAGRLGQFKHPEDRPPLA